MKQGNKKLNIENRLLLFGLTSKQAKVYLATLEMGAASVQEIAQKAGIERTNTYDSIKSLIEKRLISMTTEGKKHLFVAEPPEAFEKILEERKFDLKELVPELRSIYNVSDVKPRIRFYPGVEGFKTVYEDTLICRAKVIHGVFSIKDFIDVAGKEFLDRMVESRIKRNIRLKVIRSREKELADLYPDTDEELRDLRMAPEGMVFPITTFVYDEKVIYLSSKKETFGLIIESPDIASAHLNYFEALWQISESK